MDAVTTNISDVDKDLKDKREKIESNRIEKMSVRNIDADLAASKLNELFHLHRYDDCVLFINRLSPLALLHLLPNLPIDAYLSRLPYTIELFESLYAKVFIHDPEQFPVRTLQV